MGFPRGSNTVITLIIRGGGKSLKKSNKEITRNLFTPMSFLEDVVEIYTLVYVTLENCEISYVNFMFDFCGLFGSPPIISVITVVE